MAESKPQCTSFGCDALNLFITFLQLGQFIPQHYEMAVHRSVVGLSPWLLFFSSLYTYLAALDFFIIGAAEHFTCVDGKYRCFMKGQPSIQMAGSAILSIGMWYWYLKYYHESDQVVDSEERKLLSSFFYCSFTARKFFNVFISMAGAFTFIAVMLALFAGLSSNMLRGFAHACGVLAAGLNACMWIPQIFVTYSFGHKGALSLGWVLASVVMDVVYSVYMNAVGINWTVWANNIPDGIQTGTLLVMLIYFEYWDKKRGVDDYGHIVSSSDLEEEDDDVLEIQQGKWKPTSFVRESNAVPV